MDSSVQLSLWRPESGLSLVTGDFASIGEVLLHHYWSIFIFLDHDIDAGSFWGTHFVMYEIEDGTQVEDVEHRLRKLRLAYYIIPSQFHDEEKVTDFAIDPPCHRFKVILGLAEPITSLPHYRKVWDHYRHRLRLASPNEIELVAVHEPSNVALTLDPFLKRLGLPASLR